MREAINLIKKNEPELITDNNDEFEVDFEVMKAKTLRDLEKFVNDTMNPKKQRKRGKHFKATKFFTDDFYQLSFK